MKRDKKFRKRKRTLIDRSLTKKKKEKKKRRENCNAIFPFVNLQGLYLGHRRSASTENLSRCDDALSSLPSLVFFPPLTIRRITKKREESNPFLVIYDRNTIQPVRVTVPSKSVTIYRFSEHIRKAGVTRHGWIVLSSMHFDRKSKKKKKIHHIREIILC